MGAEHPTAGDLLDAHFGEGAPTRGEAVTAHVARCPSCRETLDKLQWLDDTLGALPEATPPPGGLDAVLDRVAPRRVAARRRLAWLAPVGVSLAGTGAGLSLVYGTAALLAAQAQVAPLGAVEATSALSRLGLAALGMVAAGSLGTLALAPVLVMDARARVRRATTS